MRDMRHTSSTTMKSHEQVAYIINEIQTKERITGNLPKPNLFLAKVSKALDKVVKSFSVIVQGKTSWKNTYE